MDVNDRRLVTHHCKFGRETESQILKIEKQRKLNRGMNFDYM